VEFIEANHPYEGDYSCRSRIDRWNGGENAGSVWKLETGNWKQNFPSAGILAIDKESMEWDHIRTGKELHEFAIANFEGQPGPYVLMVDEVQGCIAA